MWRTAFWVLMLFLVEFPLWCHAAVSVDIHVEWGYTPPNSPAVTGFNLYQNGMLVCQQEERDATFLDCQVRLAQATTPFTLTASFADDTESPPSAPYFFSVGNLIQQLYIVCLGRAADQEGLDYWVGEILAGDVTLAQLRAYLVSVQLECDGRVGSNPREEFATLIYLNLFNRAPDSVGLAYWVTGGGSSVDEDHLVQAFLNAASGAHQQMYENKALVANYYTKKLGSADKFDVYQAVTAIAEVDETSASVTAALERIDRWSTF